MKFQVTAFVGVALSLVGMAPAQQTLSTFANVAAQGGSVAGRTGRDAYQAMTSVAANAKITLENRAFALGEGPSPGGPPLVTFAKFAGPESAPIPATYSNADTNAQGSSSTQGSSMVSTSGSAPTYYTAGWGTSATSPADPNARVSSIGGTYDPWTVTYDSVAAISGAVPGSTVDLYYQSTLFAFDPTYGSTAVGAGTNGFASYVFQSFAESDSDFPLLLQIDFDTENGLSALLSASSDFDVYLLGENAENPDASPDDRIAGRRKLTEDGFADAIRGLFLPDGTPTQNLSFGFVRHIVVPSSADDPFLPFRWHTETVANSQAVPEPSALAAFGIGALALSRRRRRA